MSSYATPSDLTQFAVNANALVGFTAGQQQAALDAASVLADSKLRGRYALPLVTWDVDLRRAVAVIAAYDMLVARGYNPGDGADDNLRARYDDAMKWLDDVERQNTHPNVTPANGQTPQYDAPKVITSTRRGW